MLRAEAAPFRAYTLRDLDDLPQLQSLPPQQRQAMRVVAQVLPFRVNDYVIDELIDWNNIPDDPIYQLTFPQPGMLGPEHHARVERALAYGSRDEIDAVVRRVRMELNPHPAGQLEHNVPRLHGQRLPGVQHKYEQTVLIFPAAGQTCHAYCTFCFRWAQFVGMHDLKLATDEAMRFRDYLRQHREVTNVLVTGGDPMVMRAAVLARYLEALLEPGLEHVFAIRIGTKALSYWPYRFLTDPDADELLRLLERVVRSGRHLAIMAHFNHWRELETDAVRAALRRLHDVGAVIRTQSPVVRHINDTPSVWVKMWRLQVQLGCVPYYMFVERDTGARPYFSLPLVRAFQIFQKAFQQVSGLARTVRGPSMSALPGKVVIDGVASAAGQKVLLLRFLQGRNPKWCGRPFFARYDPHATWLDQLRPAFGDGEFFYEPELRRMLEPTPAGPGLDLSLPTAN